MENNVDDHGFIHPEFMQCVTATGRLSSRNPNFQNMPRGSTFAIRKVVESRFDDGYIMEGDYSQLEFRVAGFLAKDKVVYDDVRNGTDVHATLPASLAVHDKKPRRTPSSLCTVAQPAPKIRSVTTTTSKTSMQTSLRGTKSYRLMLCGIVRYLCRLVGSTLSQMHGGQTGVRQPTALLSATIRCRGLLLQTCCLWLWCHYSAS